MDGQGIDDAFPATSQQTESDINLRREVETLFQDFEKRPLEWIKLKTESHLIKEQLHQWDLDENKGRQTFQSDDHERKALAPDFSDNKELNPSFINECSPILSYIRRDPSSICYRQSPAVPLDQSSENVSPIQGSENVLPIQRSPHSSPIQCHSTASSTRSCSSASLILDFFTPSPIISPIASPITSPIASPITSPIASPDKGSPNASTIRGSPTASLVEGTSTALPIQSITTTSPMLGSPNSSPIKGSSDRNSPMVSSNQTLTPPVHGSSCIIQLLNRPPLIPPISFPPPVSIVSPLPAPKTPKCIEIIDNYQNPQESSVKRSQTALYSQGTQPELSIQSLTSSALTKCSTAKNSPTALTNMLCVSSNSESIKSNLTDQNKKNSRYTVVNDVADDEFMEADKFVGDKGKTPENPKFRYKKVSRISLESKDSELESISKKLSPVAAAFIADDEYLEGVHSLDNKGQTMLNLNPSEEKISPDIVTEDNHLKITVKSQEKEKENKNTKMSFSNTGRINFATTKCSNKTDRIGLSSKKTTNISPEMTSKKRKSVSPYSENESQRELLPRKTCRHFTNQNEEVEIKAHVFNSSPTISKNMPHEMIPEPHEKPILSYELPSKEELDLESPNVDGYRDSNISFLVTHSQKSSSSSKSQITDAESEIERDNRFIDGSHYLDMHEISHKENRENTPHISPKRFFRDDNKTVLSLPVKSIPLKPLRIVVDSSFKSIEKHIYAKDCNPNLVSKNLSEPTVDNTLQSMVRETNNPFTDLSNVARISESHVLNKSKNSITDSSKVLQSIYNTLKATDIINKTKLLDSKYKDKSSEIIQKDNLFSKPEENYDVHQGSYSKEVLDHFQAKKGSSERLREHVWNQNIATVPGSSSKSIEPLQMPSTSICASDSNNKLEENYSNVVQDHFQTIMENCSETLRESSMYRNITNLQDTISKSIDSLQLPSDDDSSLDTINQLKEELSITHSRQEIHDIIDALTLTGNKDDELIETLQHLKLQK